LIGCQTDTRVLHADDRLVIHSLDREQDATTSLGELTSVVEKIAHDLGDTD